MVCRYKRKKREDVVKGTFGGMIQLEMQNLLERRADGNALMGDDDERIRTSSHADNRN